MDDFIGYCNWGLYLITKESVQEPDSDVLDTERLEISKRQIGGGGREGGHQITNKNAIHRSEQKWFYVVENKATLSWMSRGR